jgi:hypothetical protein
MAIIPIAFFTTSGPKHISRTTVPALRSPAPVEAAIVAEGQLLLPSVEPGGIAQASATSGRRCRAVEVAEEMSDRRPEASPKRRLEAASNRRSEAALAPEWQSEGPPRSGNAAGEGQPEASPIRRGRNAPQELAGCAQELAGPCHCRTFAHASRERREK